MADNVMKGNGQFPVLRILNFFPSRSFSFIIPVGGEGFINSFFKLLDSSDKSIEMFQDNS
jgi:hypothetical protein